MALSPFLSGTHASIINNKLVLSNPTAINVTKWTYSGGAWSLTTSTTGIPLESIVRDSLSITQDDPEETTIDCETSDSPIKSVTKAGAWHIEMTCADLQASILKDLCGYQQCSTTGTTGTDYTVAPQTMPQQYVAIEILFGDQASLVCPKVQLTSKLDASSISSETVKVTVSGVLEDYQIGSSDVKTPFFINTKQAGA